MRGRLSSRPRFFYVFTVYSLQFTEMMWGYEKTVAESGVNLQPFFYYASRVWLSIVPFRWGNRRSSRRRYIWQRHR